MTEKPAGPILHVDTFGHPGTRHYIAFAAPHPTDIDERKSDNSTRSFMVQALFTKVPLTDAIVECYDPANGSSHLLLARTPNPPLLRTSLGTIRLAANAAGELSMAKMELQATSMQEARDLFCAALYPALDFLSVQHDIPIFVSTIRIDDVRNAIRYMGYIAPYDSKQLRIASYFPRPEIKAAYSLYREAKNSSSSPYKLLNYFKILEGLLNYARAELRREAKQKGICLTKRPELVPAPPHKDFGYPAEARVYIGRSIKEFADAVLDTAYRDAVAHFALRKESTPPLDLSVPFETWRFEDMVLPAELCARIVIENHLAWAAELK